MKSMCRLLVHIILFTLLFTVPQLCLSASVPLIPPAQCTVSKTSATSCTCDDGDSCQPALFKLCSTSQNVSAGTYYADTASFSKKPQAVNGALETAKFTYTTAPNAGDPKTTICLTPDIPDTALPPISDGGFPAWKSDSSTSYTCKMNDFGTLQPNNCQLWNAFKQPQPQAQQTTQYSFIGVKIRNDTKDYNLCIKPSNQAAIRSGGDIIFSSPYALIGTDTPIKPGNSNSKVVMKIDAAPTDDYNVSFIIIPVATTVKDCDSTTVDELNKTTSKMVVVYLSEGKAVIGANSIISPDAVPDKPSDNNKHTYTISYGPAI